MNYTKGEWKISHSAFDRCHGGKGAREFVVNKDEDEIAEVQGNTNDKCLANAHLISAAPEMYEALQKISYAVMNGNLKVNKSVAIQIYEIATPALAKAEGKEK